MHIMILTRINTYQVVLMPAGINTYQRVSMHIKAYQYILTRLNAYQRVSMHINAYQCVSTPGINA